SAAREEPMRRASLREYAAVQRQRLSNREARGEASAVGRDRGERTAAPAQDRGTADAARPVLHLAARGKLLDRSPLSSDPRSHRGAGVASDVIGAEKRMGQYRKSRFARGA